MTGEISNTNKHVLLHNFLKSDENTANAWCLFDSKIKY
jgi:hypothetical protein